MVGVFAIDLFMRFKPRVWAERFEHLEEESQAVTYLATAEMRSVGLQSTLMPVLETLRFLIKWVHGYTHEQHATLEATSSVEMPLPAIRWSAGRLRDLEEPSSAIDTELDDFQQERMKKKAERGYVGSKEKHRVQNATLFSLANALGPALRSRFVG